MVTISGNDGHGWLRQHITASCRLTFIMGMEQIAGRCILTSMKAGIVDASDTTVSNVNIFLLDSLVLRSTQR
ncbi:MAG: hypothetical protein R2788_07395 [Saprospiraceae bacterium]